MKTFILFALALNITQAFADSRLANNGKPVTCNDGDELSLTLSADRKTIKLTIRDKDYGVLPVLNVTSGTQRGDTFVIYKTSAGELILDDEADEFIDKWQAYFPDCR